MASSGSSKPLTGLIQPPHKECPIGGVTSKRTGAECRAGALDRSRPAATIDRGETATTPLAVTADFRNWRRCMFEEDSIGTVSTWDGNAGPNESVICAPTTAGPAVPPYPLRLHR